MRKLLFTLGLILTFNIGLYAQMSCVARNDCGVDKSQLFLVKGENFSLSKKFKGSKEALTGNQGKVVIYAFNKLDIVADYRMEVVYLSDKKRQQRIVADGNEIQAPVTLEPGKEQRFTINLPKRAYAYGQLVLHFEGLNNSDAIVSEINLYSSNPTKVVPFEGQQKHDLAFSQIFTVDSAVNVEEVLPVYSVKPSQVADVYKPVLSLNGTWLFNEKPSADFYKNTGNKENWKSIVVPGEWAMQGFKVDSAAFGAYQTTFILPEDWKNNQIKLRFDGVSSESVVYLNGEEVGSHMGGMTAFELDVTKYLKQGENFLALKVRSESLADMLGSLTQYAAHQIGGITRKVTLMALPKVHLSDLHVVTDFDSRYENAELKLFATVHNSSDKVQKGIALQVTVDGLPVDLRQSLPDLAPNEKWSGWLNASVNSPKKWDNEHPNLYNLRVQLGENDRSLEIVNKRFGFREVQVVGNELLVNGTPVKLRGVCRHEIYPVTGRVITEDLILKDVKLYRDANCNFIRTSHYPPCEELLDICDELGMFVEVESPVCWIGHQANANWDKLNYQDPKYYGYVLQVNMENIQFNRNHPSVLFWSIANESFWNKEFAQVQVYVEKADPTRPHTFHDQSYGGFNNQGSSASIANFHYPGPEGYLYAAKSDRPMIFGEYCHLNVYNRRELVTDPGVRSDWALALAPTWENMYITKGALGGSIWSGIDDIFQMPNGDAVGYGPWGPIDGWRRPKPEYWDMKNIYSPVHLLTKSLNPSKQLNVEIENRYFFTNLNELTVNWKYGEESGVVSVEGNPGTRSQFSIQISHPEKANGLYLSFRDPRGFIVNEYLIPVGEQVQNQPPKIALEKTDYRKENDCAVIFGNNFSCKVSLKDGQILSMVKNGTEKINGGPWLMALPLTGGGVSVDHNANIPPFNDICSNWKASSVKINKTDKGIEVHVKGSYKEFKGNYTLLVNANGELNVSYSFDALVDVNPRQWGLVFEAPSDFNKTFWRRDGLWSVYPSDHISRPVGEAELFYKGLPKTVNPRIEPTWSWSYDFNELGSNDFRSTRRQIWYAGLRTEDNSEILAVSNGKQHWRCWLEKGKIRFLVADFVSPGFETLLGAHYGKYRKPLKKGDNIKGIVQINVK